MRGRCARRCALRGAAARRHGRPKRPRARACPPARRRPRAAPRSSRATRSGRPPPSLDLRSCHAALTGTLINVGTVLLGTAIGTAFGARLAAGLQQRVLAGLALVTLVLGVDNALAWDTGHARTVLCVLGGVLVGGLAGEAIGIEAALARVGDRIQARTGGGSTVSEAFFTATLLFCVGPLTVVGAI